LFGRDVKTIGKHINNALREELSDMSTVAKFEIVQKEGIRYVTGDEVREQLQSYYVNG